MHQKLAEIIVEKKKEVARLKKARPDYSEHSLPARRDFKAAVSAPRQINLIAEIKFASPSAGRIRPRTDPIPIGRIYEDAGAAAISLLTDKRFFQGDLNYLPRLKRAVSLPILLKDFSIDFIKAMSDNGLQGAIIPDIPPEEGREYLAAMQRQDLAPILIYSPTTSLERMRYIASFAAGFIYCVARKGVTGQRTNFSDELGAYLNKCGQGTKLPLALGFGIKARSDIDFLEGKADIAVIGSQTIRVVEEEGIEAVGEFIRGLR